MQLTFLLFFLFAAQTENPGQAGTSHSPGGYRFSSKPARILPLPPPLREASGLALSADGRLFSHNDERGTVYQIDPQDGRMLKQFAVGEWRLREDLEDIAIVRDTLFTTNSRADSGTTVRPQEVTTTFYFVNSGGDLFAFSEGGDRTNVPFTLIRTGLDPRYNVEGLCHDPGTRALLLACKEYPGKGLGKVRAVYAYSLKEEKLLPEPRFLVDLKELKERYGLKDFQPSGIARHPVSGNFFVISAAGNSIIELSPGGKVLSYDHLNKRYNEQPEGIVFDRDGTLYIANEGKRRGSVSVYEPPQSTKMKNE